MPKFIDHSGKVFGSWLVVKRVGRSSYYAIWERVCVCGSVVAVESKNLFRGAKDCGCSSSLLYKKFGRLRVLEKLNNDLCNSFSYFKVICECGKYREVKGQALTSGNTVSCGCARLKDEKVMAVSSIYKSYKKRAVSSKILFDLDLDYFESLIKSKCDYCGCEPIQKHNFKDVLDVKDRFFMWNGIDRVDPEIGYLKSNCVPCCKTCNFMKLAMNKNNWLEHMIKILKFKRMM